MRTPALALISDYPKYYAEHTPDAEAVVTRDSRLSWQSFERSIDTCARALIALGVERGDRVAMLSVPSAEHLIMFLATVRLGALWQGLNPRQTYAELSYLVGDSQPLVLVGIESFEGRDFTADLQRLHDEVSAIEHLVIVGSDGLGPLLSAAEGVTEQQLEQALEHVEADDPCLLVYTSGSTGRPKGALLSHKNVVTSARTQCEHWWAEPMRMLNAMPINHVGGVVQGACQLFVAGGTNVMRERFDPGESVLVARDENITLIHGISIMYQMILDSDEYAEFGMPSVQVLIWSGAPSPLDLIRRYREVTPNLFTSYGCTELGGEGLYMPSGASDEQLAQFVGLPPENYEMRIDPDTKEIQARSDAVMLGYLNRPEATAESFTEDGWLQTGDCAEIDPKTGYWRIVGRIKEMYKSGGYNIYPREVEMVLEEHPAVAMAAVFGVPDEAYGEKGVAYLLLENGATVDEATISAHCREQLANYKVPKVFNIETELPILAIGKIDKAKLRELASSAPVS